MIRLITAIAMVLPVVANARDIDYFYTRQECGSIDTMFADAIIYYNEEPLFTGLNVTNSIDGEAYYGEMMFTVNQDTGSWSMFAIYPDGSACLINFGGLFEPVLK